MKKDMVNIRYLVPCLALLSLTLLFLPLCHSFNYGHALSQSLLYFESQRSGRLPYNQRVTWRHHSALTDGLEQGVGVSLLTMNIQTLNYVLLFLGFLFTHSNVMVLVSIRWTWWEGTMMQGTMSNLVCQWHSP